MLCIPEHLACTAPSRFAKHASSQSVEEQIDDFDVGISAFNGLRGLTFWIRNHHSITPSLFPGLSLGMDLLPPCK